MTIQALKEAAEKATPGPWVAELDSCAQCEKNGTEEFYFYPGPSGCNHATITGRADAEFIALANPSAILSLIASHQALEEALRPFALMSVEGVVTAETGHVSVTTCAEYFHRARTALSTLTKE